MDTSGNELNAWRSSWQDSIILNASKMQPGIYYLKIIGNSGIELTEKLLKIN